MSEATNVVMMTRELPAKEAKDISDSLHDDFHAWWKMQGQVDSNALRLLAYEAYLRGARYIVTQQLNNGGHL